MTLLFIAIFLSALAHILADYHQKWTLTYLFKPLTMLLIMALVLLKADLAVVYNRWILLGLALSLIGDMFLMLRPQRFIAGLVAFLLAHIAYVMAFYSSVQGNDISWLASLLLPFGLIYLGILWKYLNNYRWPVVGYFVAIACMLFFASALLLIEMSHMAKLAFFGAMLFAISDGILAWRKFKRPLKYGQFYIMTSYFAAQTLIALSAIHYWS
ncbi:lysoplasmalogenase [Kangiella sp. TOML190]|uniref:lysoplasmalogenase n=1 Tax=Kangiella sp. TOML190 TaxID=2931351 RepID=UPI00203CC817|nr:lysoplasmalogenase [Kangiella sp. TOML190]